jgi:hypothetical protein
MNLWPTRRIARSSGGGRRDRLSIAPTTLLDPRLAFAAFLLVFFLPALSILSPPHALAVACGAVAVFFGAFGQGPQRQVAWPECRPSLALLGLIFAVKGYLLAELLEFDFSLGSIVAALIEAGIAQKENVAGGVLVNGIVHLLLWYNLIGLCQKRRAWLAFTLLVAYQLLSLQTGRFLFVSQLGLLYIVYRDISGRRINAGLLALAVAVTAALFPLLHALRSGDIDNPSVDVYGAEYIAGIMASDASPGRNFSDLADYVDAAGYNWGRYLALAPVQFIPRALWDDKPTTSLQADYSRDIFGLDYKDGVTFTFTIFDSYSFFGVASLALVSFMWARLFMFVYRAWLLQPRPYMKIEFGLLLANSFNFYRGNVLDFLAPVLLALVLAYGLDRLPRLGLLRTPRQRLIPGQ